MKLLFAAGGNPLSFLTDLGVEWPMLISQALMFILVAVILYALAFKPVMKMMNEREDEISKGLSDAKEAAQKLENAQKDAALKMSEAVAEASALLAKTREDAKLFLEKSSKEASEKAADIIANAKKEIESDRIKMHADLKKDLAYLVVKTSEKVLAEALDDNTKAKIAAASAKEIK